MGRPRSHVCSGAALALSLLGVAVAQSAAAASPLLDAVSLLSQRPAEIRGQQPDAGPVSSQRPLELRGHGPLEIFGMDPRDLLSQRLVQGGQPDAHLPKPYEPSAPSLEDVPGWYVCTANKRARALQNCGSRCDVVLVGDSITEGLTSRFCYWNLTNISSCGPTFCPLYEDEGGRAFREGFKHHQKSLIIAGAGDETQHTLSVLDAVLPVLKTPKVFSVMIGTNNIPLYTMPGRVGLAVEGIKAVVARLRKEHPRSIVLLHEVLPRADDSPEGFLRDTPVLNRPWLERISEVNNATSAWARTQGPRIRFVKCGSVFPPPDQGMRRFMPDLLHPNAAGYKRWFACWEGVLDKALRQAGKRARRGSPRS